MEENLNAILEKTKYLYSKGYIISTHRKLNEIRIAHKQEPETTIVLLHSA